MDVSPPVSPFSIATATVIYLSWALLIRCQGRICSSCSFIGQMCLVSVCPETPREMSASTWTRRRSGGLSAWTPTSRWWPRRYCVHLSIHPSITLNITWLLPVSVRRWQAECWHAGGGSEGGACISPGCWRAAPVLAISSCSICSSYTCWFSCASPAPSSGRPSLHVLINTVGVPVNCAGNGKVVIFSLQISELCSSNRREEPKKLKFPEFPVFSFWIYIQTWASRPIQSSHFYSFDPNPGLARQVIHLYWIMWFKPSGFLGKEIKV